MTKKRVADVLVDTLVAAGVERIYGLAGDSLNGITDSIRPRDNIKWVPVRHEETAAFAAGRKTFDRRLAVCAVAVDQELILSTTYDGIAAALRYSRSLRKFQCRDRQHLFQETHPEHFCATVIM